MDSGRSNRRESVARRARKLVTSLIGVAAADVTCDPQGRITAIHVVPDPGTTARQVIRNIASGLMAAHHTRVAPGVIRVVDALPEPQPADPPPPAAPAAPPAHTPNGGNGNGRNGHTRAPISLDPLPLNGNGACSGGSGNGNGNGVHANGNGNGSHANGNGTNGNGAHAGGNGIFANGNGAHAEGEDAAEGERLEVRRDQIRRWVASTKPTRVNAPAEARRRTRPARLLIECAQLTREHGLLRCRIIIRAGTRRCGSQAETPDMPGADIRLAARVTLDTLRAAGIPGLPLQLNDAVVTPVGGTPHAVVSLRYWNDNQIHGLSGSAPVAGAIENAAIAAVLQAINGTADTNIMNPDVR